MHATGSGVRGDYRSLRRCIALRRNIPGVERYRVSAEDDGGGGIATHPAVQAAVAEFQGEVVAVRPRSPEGEGQ